MPFLEWRAATKSFGGARAIDGFSLLLEEGEILAILGPSGSGKSTLLRMTAGLEPMSSGRVLCQGMDLAGIPTHRRGFGLMFQDYCLFPHLTVEQNVAFGLRMHKRGKKQIRERVRDMLRLVRLEGFARRDILSLSGGEQQRVALARSLAPEPRLLMLDEPMGALDAELRVALLGELTDILRGVGVTVVYVTHDHGEAMTVATRIALVHRGRLVQVGAPADLLRKPANAFVASFLGLGALVPRARESAPAGLCATDIGDLPLPWDIDDDAFLLVRPEAVHCDSRNGGCEVPVRVISRVVRPMGVMVRIALKGRGGREYTMEISRPALHENDEPAGETSGFQSVWIDPSRCVRVAR